MWAKICKRISHIFSILTISSKYKEEYFHVVSLFDFDMSSIHTFFSVFVRVEHYTRKNFAGAGPTGGMFIACFHLPIKAGYINGNSK